MSGRRRVASVLCGLTVIVGGGCQDRPSADETDTSRPAAFGFQKSVPELLVEEGRETYARYCVGCHGVNGDGRGEGAVFLSPRPRNFVAGQFKFSSTRSGQLPTDDDLKRTIRNGLRGSAMPGFPLLTTRSIDGLVAYIKTFSPKWTERPPAAAIPVVSDPYRIDPDKSAAIRRGEAVYHGFATCWTCHPAYVPGERINAHLATFGSAARESFRPDIDQSEGKPNEEGEVIFPPDFVRDYVRSGMSVDDLYRSIAAGITGTAMPTWVDSIEMAGAKASDPATTTRADLWAMAYYVHDLLMQRPGLWSADRFEVRPRPRPIQLHGVPPAATAPAAAGEPEPPASAPVFNEADLEL